MHLFRMPKGDGFLATDFFVSENYDNGNGDGRKGCIVGKEAGSIHVYPRGQPIEKLWPAARALSHKRDGFVAPLSSADITRLGSTDPKILFYLPGVYMPGSRTVVDSNCQNILFSYQMLRDNTVHWTLNSTIDAQAAIKKAILQSNIGTGIENAVVTLIAFPISLFRAKRSVEECTIKAETLPTMEVLKHFVQKNAKR
jgi:hypothetical protein